MLHDQSLTGIVCVFDPSLDMDMTKLVNYAETRDASTLKTFDGETPTTFYIRRLTHAQLAYVRAAADDEHARIRAFKCGVMRISMLKDRDTRSLLMPDWEPQRVRDGKSAPPMEAVVDSELERFDYVEIQEIGGAVLHQSFFPKWSAVRSRLLPSSEQTLTADISRRVARAFALAAAGEPEKLSENPTESAGPGVADATA